MAGHRPAGAALFGMAGAPGGAVHAVGSFSGTVDVQGQPLVSAGAMDAFVVTLDADGDHLASRRFGDGCVQWGLAIAPAPAGLVVGGLLREGSAIDLGNGPFLGEGLYDSFVALLPPP
jgi:hypothetical protein